MTACGHRLAYIALSGERKCETCAQVAAGWKECITWGCTVMSPEAICHLHSDWWAKCLDCMGEGSGECEEDDCHGQYCEEGFVDCDTCLGRGVVEVQPKVSA